jgi:hypothetical protein
MRQRASISPNDPEQVTDPDPEELETMFFHWFIGNSCTFLANFLGTPGLCYAVGMEYWSVGVTER